MKKLIYTVSYLSLLSLTPNVYAQNCVQVPTCASLGYTRAAGSCPDGVTALTCPFDTNYIYCPEDCRLYPLTADECDDTKGTCARCGESNHYRYESCNTGWTKVDDLCEAAACDGFPSATSSITGCSATASCLSGTTTKFKCQTCSDGYTSNSSGTCTANTCNGYNSSNNAITGCNSVDSCKKGSATVYKCEGCYAGYNLSSGACTKTCTYTATGLPANCATAASCTLGSSSGNKTYYASTCTTCADGYSKNSSGLCERARYSVGDVYKYNGTAIGIVYYDDGSTTRIVALKDINKSGVASSATYMYWSTSSSGSYSYDVTGNITETTNETTAAADMNGKSNTQAILSYIASNGYTAEAATATSKYAPSVCASGSMCGAGEWYLPALGELQKIYDSLSTIQSALSSAGGSQLSTNDYYWSSTEYYSYSAWYLGFIGGGRWLSTKYDYGYVRPVLAF